MNTFRIIIPFLILIMGITHIQAEKKYLPHQIISNEVIITYSYDDKNRFTSIKKEFFTAESENEFSAIWKKSTDDGDTPSEVLVDSIKYNSDGSGYSISSYIIDYNVDKSIGLMIKNMDITFDVKDEKQIILTAREGRYDDEEGKVYFDLIPDGRVKSMGIGDDSRSTLSYRYDWGGNIIRWELSEGNSFLEFYKYMIYCTFQYDDKNGIFKHVDRTPITLFYALEDIPYIFFLANNITDIQENGRPTGFIDNAKYTYNENGYPTSAILNEDWSFKEITYIEAK